MNLLVKLHEKTTDETMGIHDSLRNTDTFDYSHADIIHMLYIFHQYEPVSLDGLPFHRP